MIIPGAKLYNWPKPTCLECGVQTNNQLPHDSAFIRYFCINEECIMQSVTVTVEKATLHVFSVDCLFKDGKPAYPAELVTAEPKKSTKGKLKPGVAEYKYEDPQTEELRILRDGPKETPSH